MKTRALSSYSINVTWSEIQASKTYGVIVSYKVTYTRKDGQGSVKVVVTSEKTALLLGLASYVDYDIKVAGGTIKGFGVNSSKVTEKTLPSSKLISCSIFTKTNLHTKFLKHKQPWNTF